VFLRSCGFVLVSADRCNRFVAVRTVDSTMTLNSVQAQCRQSTLLRVYFYTIGDQRGLIHFLMLTFLLLESARVIFFIYLANPKIVIFFFDFYPLMSTRFVRLAQLTAVSGLGGLLFPLFRMRQARFAPDWSQWNRIFYEKSFESLLTKYHVRDAQLFRHTLKQLTRFGVISSHAFAITYFWNFGIPMAFGWLVIWYPDKLLLLFFCTLPNALNMLLAINTAMLLMCAQLYHFNAYVRLLCFRLYEMQAFVRILLHRHYHPEMWLQHHADSLDSIDACNDQTVNRPSTSLDSASDLSQGTNGTLQSFPSKAGRRATQPTLNRFSILSINRVACAIISPNRQESGFAGPAPTNQVICRFVNIRQQVLVRQTLQQLNALSHEVFSSQPYFATVVGWSYMSVFFTVVLFMTIVIFDNLLPFWRRAFVLASSLVLLFFAQILPCHINMRLIWNVS
jgi:hypothetical protein